MGPLKRLIIKSVIKTPACLINYITDTSSIIRDGDILNISYDGVFANERFGLITDTDSLMRFYVAQEINGQHYKQVIDIYINPSQFYSKIAPYIRTLDGYIKYQLDYHQMMGD
jgi:hypothetical protein